VIRLCAFELVALRRQYKFGVIFLFKAATNIAVSCCMQHPRYGACSCLGTIVTVQKSHVYAGNCDDNAHQSCGFFEVASAHLLKLITIGIVSCSTFQGEGAGGGGGFKPLPATAPRTLPPMSGPAARSVKTFHLGAT
jgi:hypothetical protein